MKMDGRHCRLQDSMLSLALITLPAPPLLRRRDARVRRAALEPVEALDGRVRVDIELPDGSHHGFPPAVTLWSTLFYAHTLRF